MQTAFYYKNVYEMIAENKRITKKWCCPEQGCTILVSKYFLRKYFFTLLLFSEKGSGEISFCGIGEDCDDGFAFSQLFGKLYCRGNVGA